MNEAETRAELIDPALKAAGWGVVDASRIRREVIAPGRLEGAGRRAKPEIADYVLVYRNTKLAVIEAKRRDLADTEGVGQAKNYAGKLQSRFAFSTNGAGIYQIDMQTGAEAYVSAWPSPQELWSLAFAKESAWRDRFAAVPFVEKGSDWTLRYYQANAVNKTLERLAEGGNRVLLTLATGTGKTSIAFEIAWKLFEAKWNLSGEPTRRPRILFLADRNNLANQIATTLDDYVYTSDDEIIEGEVQEGRRYTEAEFNRIIEIKERERYRVKLFMDMINQREKTLVFCATQAHALAVRDLVNQMKTSADPHYCERVTADDGKIGDQHLEAFRNNEKTIPTILTSSQKLSTGVDARKGRIATHYDDKLQAFLDFVLAQYVSQGVEELDQEKLGALIALKYGSTHEAAATLGGVPVIRDTFVGFQRYLYET
jgi:type I site-specific restriction endonuclease